MTTEANKRGPYFCLLINKECDLSCDDPTECELYNDLIDYEQYPVTDDDLPF